MTIKEYLKINNEIITDSIRTIYAPYLTPDGQEVINNLFLLEYGKKELIDESVEYVTKCVETVLLKNYLKYTKINDSLESIIDPTYTMTRTTTPTETNTTHTPAEVKETITPTETTTTHTPAGTTTITTPAGTTTTTTPAPETETRTLPGEKEVITGPETTIESTKPFDSTEFVETSKTVSTPPTSTDKTYLNDEKTTKTYESPETVKVSVDSDETVNVVYSNDEKTEEVKTPEIKQNEVIKNEETTESKTKEIITEVNTQEQIDTYLKYIEFYTMNLYEVIVENIIDLITLRTWDIGWWNL